MINIREAESRDAPANRELYRQLVRPVAPDIAIDVRAERIEQIRRDPHNFLWVIESDREVLGTVFVTLCLDPMYSQQPYAVLENFVIHEHHRTKRYGTLLMRHAEDFCYRADCSKIMCKVTARACRHTDFLRLKDSRRLIRKRSLNIGARWSANRISVRH